MQGVFGRHASCSLPPTTRQFENDNRRNNAGGLHHEKAINHRSSGRVGYLRSRYGILRAVPNTNQNTKAVDAQTIAQLQVAAQQALADGRNGGKNNPEYGRKNYEINLLIDRLQNGQQVDPAEIDKAMAPVHIW
jgi:hypothetical protein